MKNLYRLLPCLLLSVLVSCGRSPNKPETTALESIKIKPVSGSASKSMEVNWVDAYNKGVELTKRGNLTEASYYFSNALGTDPGNFRVIEAYCKTMFDLSKSENAGLDTPYDVSVLQILEGFLQSQIPLIKYGEVAKLLEILKDVRSKIEASQDISAQVRPEYDALISKIVQGKFDFPQNDEALYEAQELLASLKDYMSGRKAQNDESDTIHKIDVLLDRVQRKMEFRTLTALLEIRKDMVRKSCQTSATIAEYQLQDCEQCLREMIAMHATDFDAEIKKEFAELEELAKIVVETKGKEAWAKILPELDGLKKRRDEINGSEGYSGEIQRKLEVLQQEATLLQNTIPGLTGDSLDHALQRRNILGEEATKLTNDQSRRYNKWAMDQITKCLDEATVGVGWIANGKNGRPTIGKALITNLGPIDRRFLTNEVSRCLDETQNIYLSSKHLNPVKDEKSIHEEGNILYTLNKMNETEKRQLSAF